jgi:hypothetical protein
MVATSTVKKYTDVFTPKYNIQAALLLNTAHHTQTQGGMTTLRAVLCILDLV